MRTPQPDYLSVDVERLLLDLTRRLRPEARWLRATVTFDTGEHGAWSMRIDSGRAHLSARVEPGADVKIRTTPEVLCDILLARRPGYLAFLEGRLETRGNIALALELESLFDPPGRRDPSYPITIHPKAGKLRWSVLAAGPVNAPAVLLLHGLGSSKVSMLEIVRGLSSTYRVYAADLPGFGDSAKPLAPYNRAWFSDRTIELIDTLGLRDVGIAGNSMGGRIALEVALKAPQRVRGIALYCPAIAYVHMRRFAPLVRFIRPEVGLLPVNMPRGTVARTLRDIFADPSTLSDLALEAAVDEFQRVWSKPRGRAAFVAAARAIYLDSPESARGQVQALKELRTPATFIFGDRDPLVHHELADSVREFAPHADVHVFENCGHVPQIERPEETIRLTRDVLR